MSQTNRRKFMGAAAALAGTAAMGPYQGLLARHGKGYRGINNRAGYGPLRDAVDRTTGQVLIRLPRGFSYRTFGEQGSVMDDGFITPPSHDGMQAFRGPGGSVRLVRNHETQFQMGNSAGAPASGEVGPNPYDAVCNGGTTTIQIDGGSWGRHGRDRWGSVESWRSASGTYFNCSGGNSTYRTWFTCEELPGGPDIGDDFFGNSVNLTQKHGYMYEVDSRWGPGEAPTPQPITQAGRFTHEGAVMDRSGYVYMTQDDFFGPSGLYRYCPPNNARRDKRVEDGGILQMLKVVGIDKAELFSHQEPGARYNVEWVNIPDPDPAMPPGTPFINPAGDDALGMVSSQGFEQGAAQFSRLEGIRRRGNQLFFSSTQGGQGREGASSTFGPGFGQIWKLNLRRMVLKLVFEAPGVADPDQPVGPGNLPSLSLPDNIAISPRGGLVMCEDGTIDRPDRGFVIPHNFMRGLSQDGELFDFAENVIGAGEFTGATFSPDGQSMFFNVQTTVEDGVIVDVGRTYEVRGPFHRGPF
ncbi:MAG: alkaline phosphatase PhoX [Pseudomonadales bacterium]